mmetsp:Transcript_33125/g.101137  ORF Transcript_33125/g.101137 Transcript_33125/m.101137 type:complete len:92 (+) Transcript_33125:263-538(+)
MRKALAGERAAETFRAGRRIYRSRVAFAQARSPNELASGEGGRVHGAKCLAVLAFAVRGTLVCSLLEGRSSSKRTVLTHDCRWSRSPLAPR